MNASITFEHIFDFTSNGVIATDAKGRIVLINGQAEEIIGVRRDQILGRPISEMLPKAEVFRNYK